MTDARLKQEIIFNRTGRFDIPASHVRRLPEPGRIHFFGLHRGSWCEKLDEEELRKTVVHIDIHSIMLLKRSSIPDASKVFSNSWKGITILVPDELTNGDHRVKIQVTIAYPSSHQEAGKILARSEEIVILDGPDGPGSSGPSLLIVRPSPDSMDDLSRLRIDDTDGPILYINTGIPGISWRTLALDPAFKHGIFSSCIREIFRHLAVFIDSRTSWGERWLNLDGVRGLRLPNIEENPLVDAWQEIEQFADLACERLLTNAKLVEKFSDAIARKGGAE
jgi:hypothetical protein